MGRTARERSVSGIYHVMIRGVDRRIIFSDDEDRSTFLYSMAQAREKTGCSIYAYCLMGNHVHLLIREGREPLAQFMKRTCVSYVYYYNQKYELLGHLLQGRFRSEGVDTDAYFLDVLRYIVQNPVKAGQVKSPWDYRWLGCGGIKDEKGLLDDVGEYTHLTQEELKAFMEQPCQNGHLEDEGPRRISDTEAIGRLCKAAGCETVQEIGGWPETKRDRALRKGMDSGISIRQLSRLTGVSKTVIEKIRRQG